MSTSYLRSPKANEVRSAETPEFPRPRAAGLSKATSGRTSGLSHPVSLSHIRVAS